MTLRSRHIPTARSGDMSDMGFVLWIFSMPVPSCRQSQRDGRVQPAAGAAFLRVWRVMCAERQDCLDNDPVRDQSRKNTKADDALLASSQQPLSLGGDTFRLA